MRIEVDVSGDEAWELDCLDYLSSRGVLALKAFLFLVMRGARVPECQSARAAQ